MFIYLFIQIFIQNNLFFSVISGGPELPRVLTIDGQRHIMYWHLLQFVQAFKVWPITKPNWRTAACLFFFFFAAFAFVIAAPDHHA